MIQGRQQVVQPLLSTGGDSHHGYAQVIGQPVQIKLNVFAGGLVQQIDAYNRAGFQFQCLKD